jgi:hypothetical protein
MSLADRIRSFAYQKYIRPALAAGRDEVTIRAGDVHADMGLQSRMPSVCTALESNIFQNQFGLDLVGRTGPARGANVFFRYRPRDLDQSRDARSIPIEPEPEPTPESIPKFEPEATQWPPPRTDSPPGTVYLVSCVGKKRPSRGPAKDLYLSDWFIKARSYVEASGCPWFILSAEHGVVAPDDTLEPYEKTLNTMPVSERRRWAEMVMDQMSEKMPDAKCVVFLAGQRYREFLENHLTSQGVAVEVPMRGLRIGEQLAWLGARRNDG